MARPWALLAVGIWLGLLVSSWAIATAQFRLADRLLDSSPDVESRLAGVSPSDRRALVRHFASESNRWMFRTWALVQCGLAAVLLPLLWTSGRKTRALVLLVVVLLLAQVFGLGPTMARLGRSLDFVPRPLPEAVGRRFGMLHGAYVLLDLGKAVVLAALSWALGRSLAG